MKRADKKTGATRNFDLFISKLSENEILDERAMSGVRGGDGVANGGELIIIIPTKPG